MTLQLAWAVQEELETLLDDSGHLRTLAFLYASKGMCSKALDIWRTLAKYYSTGLWKDPAPSVDYESLDMSTDLISGEKSAAREASKLLQGSSDQELVLAHLGWVCSIHHSQSLRVHHINAIPIPLPTKKRKRKKESAHKFFSFLINYFLSLDCRY